MDSELYCEASRKGAPLAAFWFQAKSKRGSQKHRPHSAVDGLGEVLITLDESIVEEVKRLTARKDVS